MQPILDKGLRALSAQEVEHLLTHLGFQCFGPNFRKIGVSEPCLCIERSEVQSGKRLHARVDHWRRPSKHVHGTSA